MGWHAHRYARYASDVHLGTDCWRQHSRILVVSTLSFVHKAWMIWLSNRERHKARLSSTSEIEQQGQSPLDERIPSLARSSTVLAINNIA